MLGIFKMNKKEKQLYDDAINELHKLNNTWFINSIKMIDRLNYKWVATCFILSVATLLIGILIGGRLI